jgi:hypothetical protein
MKGLICKSRHEMEADEEGVRVGYKWRPASTRRRPPALVGPNDLFAANNCPIHRSSQ